MATANRQAELQAQDQTARARAVGALQMGAERFRVSTGAQLVGIVAERIEQGFVGSQLGTKGVDLLA